MSEIPLSRAERADAENILAGLAEPPGQYDGLTPAERAVAEADEHMSTCDEPNIDDCGDCQRKLARFRKLIAAVTPVIEEEARTDERRKVYPAVVDRLLSTAAWHAPVGLADPAEISSTDLAIADAFRREAEAWQKAGTDGSPVAAGSDTAALEGVEDHQHG